MPGMPDLQLSLNCLMMLDTFSKRCGSRCMRRSVCEITRNVARSNSNTFTNQNISFKKTP